MSDGVNRNLWPGWETVRLIGRGSFGAVYEIQRDVLGDIEKAALKVISVPQNASDIDEMYSDGYDDESITSTFQSHLKSIVAEYSLMRRMNGSANIVNCDDIRYVQHDDGIGWDIFIKMELLTPLTKALPAEIPEEMAIKIAQDICEALELCKKHGIVHRDIKPQNIFLSNNGDYKLGDFGIAKTVEKTMGGTKIGTYKYMAPEVYNNQPYNCTADIYSLGLVLYWLLNERRMPFLPLPPGKISAEVESNARARRLAGEPIPPPYHGSKKLKEIVMRACAANPKERYQTAGEMLDDLKSLDGMPVISKAPVDLNENLRLDPGVVVSTSEPVDPGYISPIKPAETVDTDSVGSSKPTNQKFDPRKHIVLAIVAGMVMLVLVLRLCGGTGGIAGANTDTTAALGTTASATESETMPMVTASTTEPQTTQETLEMLPVQLDWSEWSGSLPDYVTAENYDIEEQLLYRSRTLETTSSTSNDKMDGWELYDTVEDFGDYGLWSDWSLNEVSSSEIRDVETQIRYRYRDKETTTSSSSSKDGWNHYDTTYSWGSYGSWSSWSATAVSSSDSRKVETKAQYRYADKLTTSSSSDSLSGWTLYDSSTSWSEWGSWSGWSLNASTASDSRQVETRTAYAYYCFVCSKCGARIPYQSGTSYGVCYTDLGGCGSTNYSTSWHEAYLTIPWSEATYWKYNKRYVIVDGLRWFTRTGGDESVTQYRYRDRSKITTYYYWKWDDWSSWSDTQYSATDSRKVETRTVYRYCERQWIPTYHFYRWSGWSDWSTTKVSDSDHRQVETNTFYRYRDRVAQTTYYFHRWTDWSEYTLTEVTESDAVEVETMKQYRYKSK